MKKFLCAILSLFLIVSVFFVPIKNTNFINVVAESLNYNVNFYGAENSLLYSTTVNSGSSLNSININNAYIQGFTQVSYVESNGTQYINTGVNAVSGLKVVGDFLFTSLDEYDALLSASSSSNRLYFFNVQKNKFAIGYGSSYLSSLTASSNVRYNATCSLSAGSQQLIVNNSTLLNRTSTSSYNLGINLYLFANNLNNSAEYFCNARIYTLKIYQNNSLIRDYIPVKRNLDNVYGLYDKVNNQFYSSATSTGLSGGSAVGNNSNTSLYDYLSSRNGVNVWYTSDGNVFNWSTPVTSDLNLYYSNSIESDSDIVFNIVNSSNAGLNYYNKESLKFVTIKNLNINTIPFNSLIYFGKYSGTPDLSLQTDIYTIDNDYFKYSYNVKYVYDTINNYFYSYLINFTYELKQNIPLSKFNFETFYFNHEKLENMSFSNFYMVEIIDSISFDYVLNNQYFYNSSFGFSFSSTFFEEDSLMTSLFTTINGGGYVNFIDHENNYYNSKFNDSLYELNNYFLINSESLNSNYINSIYLDFNDSIYYFSGSLIPESAEPFLKTYIFNNYGGNSPILFSGGYSEDSLSSSIIPVDSNDLYRPAEWYDIPAQLYNFLIWLIFDAPLISQFAELVYILIRFIISSFTIFISLFKNVNNSMFLGLFLGFIVLSFVFKIIFGGSKSD